MLTLRRRLITGKNRNNERIWGFVCYSLLISLKFLQQSVGLCGVILWSLIASPTGLACRLRRKWNCSHVNFVGSPASFPPIMCVFVLCVLNVLAFAPHGFLFCFFLPFCSHLPACVACIKLFGFQLYLNKACFLFLPNQPTLPLCVANDFQLNCNTTSVTVYIHNYLITLLT